MRNLRWLLVVIIMLSLMLILLLALGLLFAAEIYLTAFGLSLLFILIISTLSDVREKSPGQILLTYNVVIEIEGQETPALVADLLVLAILPPQS